MLLHSIIGFVLLVSTQAQMQSQCTCSVFNPCFNSAAESIQSCADRCQNHVTNLGASYPAARACISAHMDRIRQTFACSRASFGQICSNTPGQMVPRRFPETTQLAAFREINSMLTRSGIVAQATVLLQAGRRAFGCVMRCTQQNSCARRLGCGLNLPSDNAIVADIKGCALQAGFTTPVVRQMCTCLANAGIRQLAPMCPNIIIT